jgi:hypothetical protein
MGMDVKHELAKDTKADESELVALSAPGFLVVNPHKSATSGR